MVCLVELLPQEEEGSLSPFGKRGGGSEESRESVRWPSLPSSLPVDHNQAKQTLLRLVSIPSITLKDDERWEKQVFVRFREGRAHDQ